MVMVLNIVINLMDTKPNRTEPMWWVYFYDISCLYFTHSICHCNISFINVGSSSTPHQPAVFRTTFKFFNSKQHHTLLLACYSQSIFAFWNVCFHIFSSIPPVNLSLTIIIYAIEWADRSERTSDLSTD